MLGALNSRTSPGLTAVGDSGFFAFGDGSHGSELWASDGSAGGMRLVKDICPGACGSTPSELIELGKVAFFMANDGIHGMELWRSDGPRRNHVRPGDRYPALSRAEAEPAGVSRAGIGRRLHGHGEVKDADRAGAVGHILAPKRSQQVLATHSWAGDRDASRGGSTASSSRSAARFTATSPPAATS